MDLPVHTIIETNILSAQAAKARMPKLYEEFIVYITTNPLAGEVVPGSDGVKIKCNYIQTLN
jgi:hypothetical protein